MAATVPIVPTIPVPKVAPRGVVYSSDESDESSDEDIATQLNDFLDDDDDETDDSNEDSEDDEDDEEIYATGPPAEFLSKLVAAPPTAPLRPISVPAPISVASARPTIPLPAAVPQPSGLRLTVVPAPSAPVVKPLTLTITPQVATGLPQLSGLVAGPHVTAVTAAPKAPVIPQLAGLTITPKPVINVLPAKPPAKTIDVAALLSKMPGVNIRGLTPAPAIIPTDVNDLIQKEADETPEDFEARRRLTLKLASIPDYQLNAVAAVTVGFIMMKKSKLGLTYDPDVEAAIAYLTALLQR